MDGVSRSWVRKALSGPGAAAPQEPARDAARAAEGFGAFIDTGARFEGTLRLSASFRIDCEFRGAIVSDGTVIVGESADVEADIRAREVVISGAVAGDVTAQRAVAIRRTGRLQGTVDTPCLEIERGAVFNGSTRMVRREIEARSRQADSARTREGQAAPIPRPGARA